MPKSPFRIIAFRCLQPENSGEFHYVYRMQRSLSTADGWYKFYRDIEVDDDGGYVKKIILKMYLIEKEEVTL